MNTPNHHIDYVEFYATDLEKIKTFYSRFFDWQFTDYGPTYTAFSNNGLLGGFELTKGEIHNGALIVLYHKDLKKIENKIVASGGTISKAVFSFPGGSRFHFLDPSGNELAVWSDK